MRAAHPTEAEKPPPDRSCGGFLSEQSALAKDLAALPADARRHVSGQGHAADDARLSVVVVHSVMLGRAVFPDRHVASLHMDQVMSAMVLVGLVGALLGALGQCIETRATRWRHA